MTKCKFLSNASARGLGRTGRLGMATIKSRSLANLSGSFFPENRSVLRNAIQDPVSFNLDAVKKQIEDMIKSHHGQ